MHSGTIIATKGHLRVKRCDDCAFDHLALLPSPVEVYDRYFVEETYTKEWIKKELEEYNESLWKAEFDRRLSLIREAYRILDFGCGVGWFVAHANKRGRYCIGIEPSDLARLNSPSTKFIVPSLDKLHTTPFQAITLSLVLEHILTPDTLLMSLKRHLYPGGKILVIVPNEFNPLQNRLVEKWGEYWFIDPAHVNYFTKYSLEWLLLRNGLDVVRKSATFPMELFGLVGLDYRQDGIGHKCHLFRLRFEKQFGRLAFGLYRLLFSQFGWGRELVYVAQTKVLK